MTEFIQVFTTVDSEEGANEIASRLLEERVASCVQVFGPFKSSYWWKGKIERAREWFCLIKGMEKDYSIIESNIKKVHPYHVPEIIALPVLEGNTDYLRWIRKETSRRPRTRMRRS